MPEMIMLNYGDVPELIERETEKAIADYLDAPKDDFNYVRLNLYETDINIAIEEALTLPFFSNKKVVVLQNAYMFTGEKVTKEVNNDFSRLTSFIEKYDGDTLVIFEVFQSKLDERKKLVKLLKKHAKLKKIEQMSEDEMKTWIKQYLNSQFKEMKQDALEAFLSLTGVHYKVVHQELDKLVMYLGDRPTINKSDVQTIVNRSLEQNVFLLTEYIQQNKKSEAIALVRDLIALKEEPIKLLALITGNYRLYYQSKILANKGYSGQQIAKSVGVHPYRVKLAMNQARRYELKQLLTVIDRCADTDYKLKSSYMDKALILELFILSL